MYTYLKSYEAAVISCKTVQARRRSRELLHLTLHLIALLLEILGVYAAFKFNHEFNVEEMLTLHSWLGIITICLFGSQVYPFAFTYTPKLP